MAAQLTKGLRVALHLGVWERLRKKRRKKKQCRITDGSGTNGETKTLEVTAVTNGQNNPSEDTHVENGNSASSAATPPHAHVEKEGSAPVPGASIVTCQRANQILIFWYAEATVHIPLAYCAIYYLASCSYPVSN